MPEFEQLWTTMINNSVEESAGEAITR